VSALRALVVDEAVYASRFGSYNKSWGSLSAVVVMRTWLWLSDLALLVGAEVNAEPNAAASSNAGRPKNGCGRHPNSGPLPRWRAVRRRRVRQ
jgi:Virulence factor BrkB